MRPFPPAADGATPNAQWNNPLDATKRRAIRSSLKAAAPLVMRRRLIQGIGLGDGPGAAPPFRGPAEPPPVSAVAPVKNRSLDRRSRLITRQRLRK